MAARRIDFAPATAGVLGLLLAGGLVLTLAFARTNSGRLAKGIESYSGIWTLALYLTLGVAPLFLRA
jgi:hypothetical protein